MPLWAKDQRTSASQKALTNNVSFALVNPQGPMNVGSCARVMQNFGIYDLKIVRGSAFVFDPADADDAEEDAEQKKKAQSEGTLHDILVDIRSVTLQQHEMDEATREQRRGELRRAGAGRGGAGSRRLQLRGGRARARGRRARGGGSGARERV